MAPSVTLDYPSSLALRWLKQAPEAKDVTLGPFLVGKHSHPRGSLRVLSTGPSGVQVKLYGERGFRILYVATRTPDRLEARIARLQGQPAEAIINTTGQAKTSLEDAFREAEVEAARLRQQRQPPPQPDLASEETSMPQAVQTVRAAASVPKQAEAGANGAGPGEWLSLTEVADKTGHKITTLKKWARDGSIPVTPLGGGPLRKFWYVKLGDLPKIPTPEQVKEANRKAAAERLIRVRGKALETRRRNAAARRAQAPTAPVAPVAAPADLQQTLQLLTQTLTRLVDWLEREWTTSPKASPGGRK